MSMGYLLYKYFLLSSFKFSNKNCILQIIDLETDEVPMEKNLQESLRRKRPDYIKRTQVSFAEYKL